MSLKTNVCLCIWLLILVCPRFLPALFLLPSLTRETLVTLEKKKKQATMAVKHLPMMPKMPKMLGAKITNMLMKVSRVSAMAM